ncbi:pyridoxamine 5'-phosphate oxidase family protein [Brevundimonas vesicularis]|uniref:Pyridoxamine 5'-phosphate oxidase family protein n=1 Tax=Brevundimonas vesicularis TaxID=41276 RepID=A0ABU4KLD6_BREVE|nr:pyridoxamine 5'-phosphate oxidase family protein [Brevundimonas vesicularis]MDX2333562.1 pyridoxamine 5'-phosphate oxidase family protein [Brevundimonas vesicularis]
MPATDPYPPIHGQAVETIVSLLAHERLMSIGVNRPDGWPQVTTVGYINDGLDLYFVTSRESQKLANIQEDHRVSVSIHSDMDVVGAVGISMAARATEVTDPIEIERLNRIMRERWPSISVYCPATSSVAIIHLEPERICVISAASGRSKTECFSLVDAADTPTSGVVRGPGPGAVSAEARLF